MNFEDLLSAKPDLAQTLSGLGLSDSNIGALTREIGRQLQGDDGFDLTDLLSGFDAGGFLSRIDIASVTERIGISPDLASSAISTIAPAVAEFTGQAGISGALGGITSGLFGKG